MLLLASRAQVLAKLVQGSKSALNKRAVVRVVEVVQLVVVNDVLRAN